MHCNYFSLTLWADFCFNNENLAEFYEDEPTLEQYSPLLGENFITYPMLEEYGVPTVEEFPEEGPDEEDEDDEKEEDSLEAEHKDKKNGVTRAGGRENSAFALLFKTEMGELLCHTWIQMSVTHESSFEPSRFHSSDNFKGFIFREMTR